MCAIISEIPSISSCATCAPSTSASDRSATVSRSRPGFDGSWPNDRKASVLSRIHSSHASCSASSASIVSIASGARSRYSGQTNSSSDV
jgi:hypothetical protein